MRATEDPKVFSRHEHGLGDEAFKASHRLVPPYKLSHSALWENTFYNRCHSSLRVSTEHTIGVVKNRFQGLRDVQIWIKDKTSYIRACEYTFTCYVIHNILVEEEYRCTERDMLTNRGGLENLGDGNNHSSDGDDLSPSGEQFRELVNNEVLEFHSSC